MSIEKTDAISLGAFMLGDSSRVVSFFTRDFGLIKCVAKGSRSSKSRYGAALEPFSLSRLVFYYRPKKELFTLSQAEIVNYFPYIRKSLYKTACSYSSMEILRHMLVLGEAQPALFKILCDFLDTLETERTEEAAISHLLSHLFSAVKNFGFQPDFKGCRKCGKSGVNLWLDLRQGCLYCNECTDVSKTGRLELSVASAGILSMADRGAVISDALPAQVKEAVEIMVRFLSLHIEKPFTLSSLSLLQSPITC